MKREEKIKNLKKIYFTAGAKPDAPTESIDRQLGEVVDKVDKAVAEVIAERSLTKPKI